MHKLFERGGLPTPIAAARLPALRPTQWGKIASGPVDDNVTQGIPPLAHVVCVSA